MTKATSWNSSGPPLLVAMQSSSTVKKRVRAAKYGIIVTSVRKTQPGSRSMPQMFLSNGTKW